MLSIYSMVHIVSALVVSVLLLATPALASSSNSYGAATYTPRSIPTLTAAILGPPFVNTPSEHQFLFATDSISALTTSTNTIATKSWMSLRTTEVGTPATSSISKAYTSPGASTQTNLSGDYDQTVACINALDGRSLMPTPVKDSGNTPLTERSMWTWWTGWGIVPTSMCMWAML